MITNQADMNYRLDGLAKIFDVLVNPFIEPDWPTEESINFINHSLNIELPSSLIYFAKKSTSYCSFFASIGEQYQKPGHIIRTNSRFKKIRRRRNGKWRAMKPKNFVVFNLGFDDECVCFDANHRNLVSGEYLIKTWTYSVVGGLTYQSFPDLIESFINFAISGLQPKKLDKMRLTIGEDAFSIVDSTNDPRTTSAPGQAGKR